MEIVLNTDEKAIVIKDEANIGELVKTLKKYLGIEWRQWTIRSVVKTEHYYPYPWWYKWWPVDEPYTVTCGSDAATIDFKAIKDNIICLIN